MEPLYKYTNLCLVTLAKTPTLAWEPRPRTAAILAGTGFFRQTSSCEPIPIVRPAA
jgi:hypothetical protein